MPYRRSGWAIFLSGLQLLLAASAQAEDIALPQPEGASEPVEEQIEPTRLSMEFREVSLKDLLKTFSQQTGINIIASGEVADQIVTLYFEDVTVMDALDQILKAGNLTYERDPGSDIYIVKAKPAEVLVAAPTVALVTRVYRLRYARVSESVLAKAAAAFGDRTPFEAILKTEESGGQAGGGFGAGAGANLIGVDTIIEELLSDQGHVVVDSRTNSIVITDLEDNFPKIEAVLGVLDVRTAQVLVDTEVLETSANKLKDLGFEWGTGSEGTLFQLTPAKRGTRFPFSQLFGNQGRETVADPTMTVGTIDASQAVMMLQALQTDTDTKILARPKVLTLDNESAIIRLTTDEAIGFETSSQATTGTATSEPERTITGVVLVVTPQVNENGYITMLVEPAVTKTVSSQISPPTGQATPRDPKTRSTRTLVRVRSGDTLRAFGIPVDGNPPPRGVSSLAGARAHKSAQ
ncbi:MAG: hypothetical protein HYT88_05860 [Candidatus Omnitrophica bacterium]|nr:hypothetical protein [Candidatus Omnitrophota bacterium]